MYEQVEEIMSEILLEAIVDTLKIIPFLYVSYLILDFIEKRSSVSQLNFLFLKHLGPLFGALLGCIPQCGFSVIAASVYAQGGISAGTLVACFISTSDEALPLFLSNPDQIKHVGGFILIKVLIALIGGYTIDLFYKKKVNEADDFVIELDGLCGCGSNSWINALQKTVKTISFVLMVNVILGLIIYWIGEDSLASLLHVSNWIQPIVAAFIGFIPNCAVSVVLAQLYFMNILSFGALIAGLSTGAGLGMAVLFKQNKNRKENMGLIIYLWGIAVIAGLVIDLVL